MHQAMAHVSVGSLSTLVREVRRARWRQLFETFRGGTIAKSQVIDLGMPMSAYVASASCALSAVA